MQSLLTPLTITGLNCSFLSSFYALEKKAKYPILLYMLKITLEKEKKDLYFASVNGIEWAYAQGDTPETCLDNLESVLWEVLSLKMGYMKTLQTDAKKLELTF